MKRFTPCTFTIVCVNITLMFAAPPSARCQVSFSVAPGGPSGLASDIIFDNVSSVPALGGTNIDLGLPGDDVDGFSEDSALATFLLCFSVDNATLGGPAPQDFSLSPFFTPGLPQFNVTNQAVNNQQAGDAFLTTEAFDRAGILSTPTSLGLSNNVLAINQSQVYRDNFQLMPLANPNVAVSPGGLDDVNGGGVPLPTALYFTADAASPSLPAMRGAHVFFDPTADVVAGASGDRTLFATPGQLGLLATDEIDALVIFDDNDDGVFNGTDQVLYSLAPASPSLGGLLPGMSPADIFSVSFATLPALFASSTDLGLLGPADNINMLALVPLLGDALTTVREKTKTCDLTSSSTPCDIEDIDMLIMNMVDYDLNGVYNRNDIQQWLADAGADPGNSGLTGGNPFLEGDFNLDGVVDGLDFIIWNSNKFDPAGTGKYSLADANGDGFTDGADFIIWNDFKFRSADELAMVPEPIALGFVALGAWMIILRRSNCEQAPRNDTLPRRRTTNPPIKK